MPATAYVSTDKDLVALQAILRKQEKADQLAEKYSEFRKLAVKVGNTSSPASKDGYFNWKLFVYGDGDYCVQDRIKQVTFVLHPSFKNNVIVMKQAPFEITRCGWGTFEVTLELEVYTDPSKQHTQKVALLHELSFDEAASIANVNVDIPVDVTKKTAPAKPADIVSSAGAVKGSLFRDLAAEVSEPKRNPKQLKQRIARAMHGTRGDANWASPVKIVHCDLEARPGYATRKAHEYNETPAVLRAKVALLADMVRHSKQMAAYTGAGISTASGIGDYASKAKDTSCGKNQKKKKGSSMDAEPTLAHRVLAAMHTAGYLKHWVQQNHDGLPQKAGFPQAHLNEIHGAWQDPSNPVVPMSGHLRRDLVNWLEEWEDIADLCVVLGTSMCGMAADDFALAVNRRAHAERNGLGMVVVSLQQTQHDSKAALRIFAKIDDVMALLVEELNRDAPSEKIVDVHPYSPSKPLKGPYESIFHVLYRSNGEKIAKLGKKMVLDLRPGAPIRVTRGVGKGYVGSVRGMTATGDYALRLPLQREGHPQRGKKMSTYILGRWWVQDAIEGKAAYLPVVNNDPVFMD